MAQVTIEVTAEDIATRAHTAFTCPIALATSRAIDGNGYCDGYKVGVFARNDRAGWHKVLPPEVQEWRRAYDAEEPVQPITFTVEVPS